MRREASTDGGVIRVLRWQSLLTVSVVVLLLACALSTAIGTALGLAKFKDQGYPDSATLFKVGELVHSGHIYPDPDRPPYLVTIYGPLTYVLLAPPYMLAQATGVTPQVQVRLGIVGAFCLCVFLIFLISRRLHNSRSIAWLCALFAVSALPLGSWTTQIRGDFIALAFSLLSIYWFLLANERTQPIGAAICAGIALLVKQTFVAAPFTIAVWLIYRRRYKDAFFWAMVVALTVIGGNAIAWWHEPLMLKHLAALRRPILEYRIALDIFRDAIAQPVVPFAALGGLVVLWKRVPETILLLIYCVSAWLVAILTLTKVGGNINYFWEPFLASAMLAGPALYELQSRANRTPIIVTAMLLILLLRLFLPMLWNDFSDLRVACYATVKDYQVRKNKWQSFVSTISGRRLLSTIPELTIHSTPPEIPDPFLNSELERRGMWNSAPVVAQINAEVFDLIIVRKGEAQGHDGDGFRGIRYWDNAMWAALKKTYGVACVFDEMEVWLPNGGSREIPPGLSAIGCVAPAK